MIQVGFYAVGVPLTGRLLGHSWRIQAAFSSGTIIELLAFRKPHSFELVMFLNYYLLLIILITLTIADSFKEQSQHV